MDKITQLFKFRISTREKKLRLDPEHEFTYPFLKSFQFDFECIYKGFNFEHRTALHGEAPGRLNKERKLGEKSQSWSEYVNSCSDWTL